MSYKSSSVLNPWSGKPISNVNSTSVDIKNLTNNYFSNSLSDVSLVHLMSIQDIEIKNNKIKKRTLPLLLNSLSQITV